MCSYSVIRVTKRYLDAGKNHTIAVRVVDVFGNDATATVKVEI